MRERDVAMKNRLKKEILRMELVDSVTNSNDHIQLFLIATGGIVEIKKYRDLTNEGKFEVIIFNSIYVLNDYRLKFPSLYEDCSDKYFELLIKKANHYELFFNDIDNTIWFINQRMTFYSNQANQLQNSTNFMSNSIYNAFYENPLCLEPKISQDALNVIEFHLFLLNMIEWIKLGIIKINSQKN